MADLFDRATTFGTQADAHTRNDPLLSLSQFRARVHAFRRDADDLCIRRAYTNIPQFAGREEHDIAVQTVLRETDARKAALACHRPGGGGGGGGRMPMRTMERRAGAD